MEAPISLEQTIAPEILDYCTISGVVIGELSGGRIEKSALVQLVIKTIKEESLLPSKRMRRIEHRIKDVLEAMERDGYISFDRATPWNHYVELNPQGLKILEKVGGTD